MGRLHPFSTSSEHQFSARKHRFGDRLVRRRRGYAPSFDEWTDSELDAHAARLNIQNHSQMTREELIASLGG